MSVDQTWNCIREVAEKNNGFIKTAEIEEIGISRPLIKRYVDQGLLEAVCRGLYILTDDIADEYALLQVRSKYAVFSHGTALFLWGLSDRTPHIYDITVPQGSNVTLLKRDNANLRCHYAQQDQYEIGITEVKSPQGAMVRVYDKEKWIKEIEVEGRKRTYRITDKGLTAYKQEVARL